MSKSKFCKILIATLSLCLILGAAIGISAFAADEKDEKGVVIDFDSDFDYSSYISWFIGNSANAEANTFEIVEVDGNKKLHLKKTATGDGMYVRPVVSYYEEYGNVAILEFDVRYENVSSSANQITVSHAGGSGNSNTPFLISLPGKNNVDMHVTLTYRVTDYNENGDAAAYELVYQVNDDEPTVVTSVRGENIISGKTKLPKAADLTNYAIDLNYGFKGDVYYDNFCAKVVHEHKLAGGVCECGLEDPEYDGITIISKNVAYGSKTYLHYAVPVSDISAEDQRTGNVWLNVYNADGTLAFKQFPEEEPVDIYGDGTICYVFKSRGVPAKELNTIEMVEVETASGAKSALESYSVEEYLYEKLYDEGFAAKTAEDVGEDGKDYIRRNLYYNLLKYGMIAQELLNPDAEDKIGDSSYVKASEALASLGKFEKPTKVFLTHDDKKTPAGSKFLGWKYTFYDGLGEIIKTGYAANRSSIITEGYAIFEPVYFSIDHDYITFDDGSIGTITTSIETALKKIGAGTYGIVDGKYVATKTMNITELKNAVNNWNAANPDNQISVPGSTSLIPYVGVNKTVANANIVEFEADFSFKNNGASSLEYLEIFSGKTASNVGTKIWGSYVKISDGRLYIDSEYGPSGTNDHKVNFTTPIKTDGTVYKLAIRYYIDDAGQGVLEFYCDGELFYTSTYFATSSTPAVSQFGSIRFRMSNSPKATLTLDNVAFTQAYNEYVYTEFEELCVDKTVNDFGGMNDDYTLVNVHSSFAAQNTWETVHDPVTGDGYLHVNKQATDTSSGANGGISFKTTVTEKQENANFAILEFDMQLLSATKMNANQFTLGHQGLATNGVSPFISGYGDQAIPVADGKYHHISMSYRVLTVDEAGVPIDYIYQISVDGKVVVYGQLPSYKATSLKVNGGSYDFPKISQVESMTFAFNNAFLGEAYFDNFALRLIRVEGYDPVLGDKLTNVPTTSETPDITFEQMPETSVLGVNVNSDQADVETVASYTDNSGVTKNNVLHINKHTSGANASFVLKSATTTNGTGDALVVTFDALVTNGVSGVEFYYDRSSCIFEAQSFLTKNKWCEVTIVIKQVDTGINMYLYVNGVATKAGFMKDKTIGDAKEFKFQWWGSAKTDCYIANMTYERTNFADLCK